MGITFLQLCDEYNEDINITKENLEDKLYSIPVLFGKYHKWLYKWKQLLYKKETDLKELYREKYKYYKNESQEVLSEKEIKWHIESDDEYSTLYRKVKIIQNEVEQIDDWCKYCSKLSFFCNNIISWQKFINGKD